MKKNWFTTGVVLTSLILGVWCLTVYAEEKNLAPNGGFEDGADKPTGWGQGKLEGDAAVAWDATTAHAGKKSLKISVQAQGQGVWSAWLDNGKSVPVTQGKSYKLKFYAKTADGYDGKAQVYFNVWGPDNKWCASGEVKIPAGDSDWQLCEKTFPAESNWTKIYVIYFSMPLKPGAAKGTVWVDDVELTEVQ